jgi:phosphoglycolate phosphatase
MEDSLSPVLVLDFDGVLVHLDIDWDQIRKELSGLLGIKIISLNAFWDQHFGTESFRQASEMVERHELAALDRARPGEDVAAAIRAWGARCYVASMQSEKVLGVFSEKYGLGDHVHRMLGRNAFGSKKNQLLHIVKSEGGPLSKYTVIDDSKLNKKTCDELGLRCILFGKKDRLSDTIGRLIG